MDIYKINDIAELIKDNAYVGRGIVIGKTADAKKAAVAYFIMGRSATAATAFLLNATRHFLPNLLMLPKFRTRALSSMPHFAKSATNLLLPTATRPTPFITVSNAAAPSAEALQPANLNRTLRTLPPESAAWQLSAAEISPIR